MNRTRVKDGKTYAMCAFGLVEVPEDCMDLEALVADKKREWIAADPLPARILENQRFARGSTLEN